MTQYHNILSNPTLQTTDDALHVETIHELGYPPQFIYHPIQWKTTVIPTMPGEIRKRSTDLHVIPTVWPQTVDGKRVLTIEVNYKHFIVNLTQQKLQLKAGQRYLVKVVFNPAVIPQGQAEPSALSWRITTNKRDDELTDQFQCADHIQEWGTPRSALLVLHSYETQAVDLQVEFWSQWGNLDKQVYIHSIEMLEVEATYGEGGSVHYVGDPTAEAPDTTPEPIPTYQLLGCNPLVWIRQLFGTTESYTAQRTELFPPAPGCLKLVFTGLSGLVLASIFYSLHRPRMAAQGVRNMEIFKSKRFWSAVIGLAMMVVTSLIPELEQHADTLIPAILLVISLLIGGYAVEDYQEAKAKAS